MEKTMTEEQKNLVAGIHAALESLQGTDDDILFLESRNNRGVLSGSIEGLATLFAFNMVAYPQFKLVADLARILYDKHSREIEKFVAENKPSHEIVNNFGNDFDEIFKRVKGETK